MRSAQASHGSGRQLPAEMLEQSNRHRSLVKAHEATITAATREMTDLASFVAAIERHRRATSGGGSVSSSLFVDERLSDVTVAGARANARRHHRSGHEELLGFEQRRGEWQIVLFGRPGAR